MTGAGPRAVACGGSSTLSRALLPAVADLGVFAAFAQQARVDRCQLSVEHARQPAERYRDDVRALLPRRMVVGVVRDPRVSDRCDQERQLAAFVQGACVERRRQSTGLDAPGDLGDSCCVGR